MPTTRSRAKRSADSAAAAVRGSEPSSDPVVRAIVQPVLSVRNATGRRVLTRPLVSALEAFATSYHVSGQVIDVLVTDDDGLRELNARHRGVDEATDVLSFEGPGWPGAPLGDIAISLDFAQAGAKKRGVPVSSELAFLAVHGALHLVGFDDSTNKGRDDMVRRMNEVMDLAGLPRDDDWHSLPHGEEWRHG